MKRVLSFSENTRTDNQTGCIIYSSSTASEISAYATQFLQADVVQFVTELVHRAIDSREEGHGMTEHTRVWKFSSKQVRNRSHRAMHTDRVHCYRFSLPPWKAPKR